MKHLLITLIALFLIPAAVSAQKIEKLKAVKSRGSIKENESVIYGLFVQRLGFSSGGNQQEIRVLNIDTEKIYSFEVKPAINSKKKNIFCYNIPPGRYLLLNYLWMKGSWGLAKQDLYIEPIYKNVDASTKEYQTLAKKGRINQNNLEHYQFTIVRNTTNYLGTWHFDTGLISFSEDKSKLDEQISQKYKSLDLSVSIVNLPE